MADTLSKLEVTLSGQLKAVVGGEFSPSFVYKDGSRTDVPRTGDRSGLPIWTKSTSLVLGDKIISGKVAVESSEPPEPFSPDMVTLPSTSLVTVAAPFGDGVRGLQVTVTLTANEYKTLSPKASGSPASSPAGHGA